MDYRSMVNPTYLTAKTTLYFLAEAGNQDARKMIAELNIQDEIRQTNQKDSSGQLQIPEDELKALMTGSSLAVVARYERLSHYLKEEGCRNLLDIACGFTPRVLYCEHEGIDYVGVEVPVVAEKLLGFASRNRIGKSHPAYVGGDATNAASLLEAAEWLKGKLLISCEGLTQYLSGNEFAQLIGGIREILLRHGGAWITSDFGVDYEAFATANMSSPDAVRLYNETREKAMRDHNIYSDGVARWSAEKIQEFLESHGMIVEKLPFWDPEAHSALLEGLPEAWKENLIRQLKASSLWKMTADPYFRKAPSIQGAKQVDNLNITFASDDEDQLLCIVNGRIDTISAPALMEVLENSIEDIKTIRIEAGSLEYISSAGLRVLLMAVKKLGPGTVTVVNASDPVKEIFTTTGFDQMIDIL